MIRRRNRGVEGCRWEGMVIKMQGIDNRIEGCMVVIGLVVCMLVWDRICASW